MMEVAITYSIVAWLACWWIDLVVLVARSPAIPIDPVIKLIVVTLALLMILFALQRHHWLMGSVT